MSQVIVTSKDELENLIQTAIRKILGEFGNYKSEQEQDKIFSVKEASAFLNLAQQTLYGFTSKREIPFIKSIPTNLIPHKKDIEGFREYCKVKS